MQKVLTTILLGSAIFCNAQSLDEWMARKQRLQIKQTQINDSLRIVDEKIQKIKIDRVKNENGHRSTTVRVSTRLTKNPTNAASSGEVIRFLDRGDTVEVFGWQWSHVKVSTNKNEIGYVSEFDVDRRENDFDSFVATLKLKFMEEYRQEEDAKERERSESAQKNKKLANDKAIYEKQERAKSISAKFNKYGAVVVNNIIDGKVWVGMTADMARASWGDPDKVNKTITTGRVKEQWVYKDDYLYFEGGSLIAIQTSR